jgi:hypothetical protein
MVKIDRRRRQRLFRALLAVWLACVILGSLASGSELASLEKTFPFLAWSDKIQHFGAYGVLAVLWMLALEGRRRVTAALSMIFLGVQLEAAQHFAPGRTPDLGDAVANALGVVAGMALGFVLTRQSSASVR